MIKKVKHRVFLDYPGPDENGKIFAAGKRTYHYLINVLRLKVSNYLIVFNGKGYEFVCVILSIDKKDDLVVFEVLEERKNVSADQISISLAQAVIKGKKMDFVLQKCTEIGVCEFLPFISKRTVFSKEDSVSRGKYERWQKIAMESSRQSGRLFVPQVSSICAFNELVKKSLEYDLALIPCLDDRAKRLKEELGEFKGRTILLFIGPEGGFDRKEVTYAIKNGVKPVSLGDSVLRSETASVVVSGILRYELDK